jgi:integrase/recombinase XerD
MTRLVSDISDCHPHIQTYWGELQAGTDDNDPDLRDSTTTRRYGQDLRWYQAWLNDQDLDFEEVERTDAKRVGITLGNEYNGSTAPNRWRTIHRLYSDLVIERVFQTNPFAPYNDSRIKNRKFGFGSGTEQEKHLRDDETYALDQDQIRKMEDAAVKPRNQLLIRLLWQTGLRRSEVSGLLIDDLDRPNREITVRQPNAKNDQKRVVPYQHTLDGLLKDWLDHGGRQTYRDWNESDHLFLTERSHWMRPGTVWEIVVDIAEKAGLQRDLYTDSEGRDRSKITPHNIRHGYGTYMVHNTDASIYDVSKLMGHKSTKTTEQKYVGHDPRQGVDAGRSYGPE